METPGEKMNPASFMELWAESVATVLGQIASAPCTMSLAEPVGPQPESGEQDTYLNVTASGALRGEFAFRLPGSSARAMADMFTGEAKPGVAITDDDRAAIEELFRQVAGYVCSSAKSKAGVLQMTVAAGAAPTWSAAASGWITSAQAQPNSIAIQWNLSAALNQALTALEPPIAEAGPGSQAAPSSEKGTLDIFMNLELDVSIRFGGRDVLLKDVLELGPGAVLELDREVNDPADLLLDGKLIARGEVVLVDGLFGMKITQVMGSPQIA